jgi:hypothetical protein
VSPTPNWTAMGPARIDARHTGAAVTASARIWAGGSVSLALDWTPAPPRHISDALRPPGDQVGCPSPEPGTNWDWPCARARSL